MEVIIGKTAGFCFGVSNAVNKTQMLVKEKENISCLGELVHNKQVTEELENDGLKIIDNIEEAKENVIIRAHGEPKETYNKAKELKLNVFDLTCPKVLKIHKIAKEYSNNGFYIFLIGHKIHPETVATISYCGNNSAVIESERDLEQNLEKFYKSEIKKLLVIVQTTYSLENFKSITDTINEKFKSNDLIEVEFKNTICDATKLRQEETEKLSREVECMIVIGGKHSSNTNKLYQIAKANCENSLLIETIKELDAEHVKKFNKVGVMAGASTPKKSIDSVIEKLNQI